jgi:hypothetical protein
LRQSIDLGTQEITIQAMFLMARKVYKAIELGTPIVDVRSRRIGVGHCITAPVQILRCEKWKLIGNDLMSFLGVSKVV